MIQLTIEQTPELTDDQKRAFEKKFLWKGQPPNLVAIDAQFVRGLVKMLYLKTHNEKPIDDQKINSLVQLLSSTYKVAESAKAENPHELINSDQFAIIWLLRSLWRELPLQQVFYYIRSEALK